MVDHARFIFNVLWFSGIIINHWVFERWTLNVIIWCDSEKKHIGSIELQHCWRNCYKSRLNTVVWNAAPIQSCVHWKKICLVLRSRVPFHYLLFRTKQNKKSIKIDGMLNHRTHSLPRFVSLLFLSLRTICDY